MNQKDCYHISNYELSDIQSMNLLTLMKVYKTNKEFCNACMRGDDVECYTASDTVQNIPPAVQKAMGEFTAGVVIGWVVLFTIALILTIKRWNRLPIWARIVCVLGLVPSKYGTATISIVVALIASKPQKKKIKKR